MTKQLLIIILTILLGVADMATAQQSSRKFAHVTLPDEIKYLTWNDNGPYAGNYRNIWKIGTKTWTTDSVAALKSKNLFKTIQGIAGHGNDLYFYVNEDGVYRLQPKGMKPQMVRPRGEDFVRNYEEAYSGMNVDPSGRYLLLYGKNENAVMFDILQGMKPVLRFDDYVRDAYWLGNKLWAGCLDKVVIDYRKGKTVNNEDFMGMEDQQGLTKFYIGDETVIPKNGETRIVINDKGDIVRLLHNKQNGDVLLCISSPKSTSIYRMTDSAALPVATLNGMYGDFAAYGNRIVAVTGGGFVEFNYGDHLKDAKATPIITDILRPKLWKGAKPDPYKIYNSTLLDFDKQGNLWIGYGRDLFVRFNH